MRGGVLLAAAFGLVAGGITTAVLAQGGMNDACVNQINGAYDAVLSADWQGRFGRTDQNGVRRLAGVWYGEIPNAELGMIAYQYQSFQPSQIFDVRTKTCSNLICSDSYGTGMFAAETQGDGSVFVTTNFSDNNRRNACSGGYVRFPDSDTMITGAGFVWKRAQ